MLKFNHRNSRCNRFNKKKSIKILQLNRSINIISRYYNGKPIFLRLVYLVNKYIFFYLLLYPKLCDALPRNDTEQTDSFVNFSIKAELFYSSPTNKDRIESMKKKRQKIQRK